jgi:hypothetical protein
MERRTIRKNREDLGMSRYRRQTHGLGFDRGLAGGAVRLDSAPMIPSRRLGAGTSYLYILLVQPACNQRTGGNCAFEEGFCSRSLPLGTGGEVQLKQQL